MTPPLPGGNAVGDRMHYVYLLRSAKNGQLYLGWTTDLQRRLCRHNDGLNRSTQGRGPYEIIYYEAYRHREEAIAREGMLKKYPNLYRQLKKRLSKTLAMASSALRGVVG